MLASKRLLLRYVIVKLWFMMIISCSQQIFCLNLGIFAHIIINLLTLQSVLGGNFDFWDFETELPFRFSISEIWKKKNFPPNAGSTVYPIYLENVLKNVYFSRSEDSEPIRTWKCRCITRESRTKTSDGRPDTGRYFVCSRRDVQISRDLISKPTHKVNYMDTKRLFINIRGWPHFQAVFFGMHFLRM